MANDFIEIYDNALSADFCQSFIETFDGSPHRQQGRTGGGVDTSKKLSTDLYLNQHPEYQQQLQTITEATRRCALAYFKKYRFALIAPLALQVRHPRTGEPVALTHENFDEVAAGNEAGYMELLYRLGAIQAQKYERGQGNYNYWHCEVFPEQHSTEALHRTLLFMFYLNDVEVGGSTDFYYQERSIQPRQGRMVIAPGYFTHTHRGTVPVSNDKYILTSWILMNSGQQLFGR
ncbi:2OG-Fe(II) oxygenase [Pseudidiomarina sp. 1ASP75-14]|uniref:2OG-Fe(II) oxygenase n=1 Tax=Pseudidiomarina terrestris TaxID=2820060 RepID=UPI0026543C14|nr:2OG-Fe(II) oxygenase [Pseudidiomarina sp. 1ASP75-14]MDN7138207.1 2OG-Fe(II) oxygenase [Pseudidiomarina sp. 1ASP75-14]